MNQIEAQRLKALIDQLTDPIAAVGPAPYVQTQTYADPPRQWVCPIHGVSKVVPAGFSQRTQKPYNAFVACPAQGCNQRPPRENAPQGAQDAPGAAQGPVVAPDSTLPF